VIAFVAALIFVTGCILSIGFLIASIVPTARFAQPIGSLLLYPMVAISGLFVPVESLPRPLELLSRALPLTYAVSLLQGIWQGERWSSHLGEVTALVIAFAVCTALSTRVFRWE
jgi:ABC-2 type transport system permease protein